MRVHLCKHYITGEQADIMEEYLKRAEGVRSVRMDERTGNATVYFAPSSRQALIDALSSFDYESVQICAPDHSSRTLNRQYEDRMFRHVAGRLVRRFLLPLPVRTVITAVHAVPYLGRGAASLLKGRLEVSVLDAASIAVSMVRGDFDTAGSVMFLLRTEACHADRVPLCHA